MIDAMLLPEWDEDSEPYFDAAARGELRVQRCSSCGALRFPPRPMCSTCRSFDVVWERLGGRGTIWSWCVPHPPLLPAYAALAPYNVIVVAIEEDPTIRFCGNLVASPDGAINEIDPSTIRIGEPVRVVFPAIVDGVVLPRWVRDEHPDARR
jgi:uncharacterized OB-fold protein